MAKKAEEPENLPAVQGGGNFAVMPSDMMDDLEVYAGAGGSDSQEDKLLPFLAIAQSNSPQVKKQDPKYIKGLEVGDIFNTATESFWPGGEGVHFVWAKFLKFDVEWWPRSEGGGYVATHPWPSGVKTHNVDGRRMTAQGTQMTETGYYFGVLHDTMDPVVIGMSSTNLGVSRRWHTVRDTFKVKTREGKLVVAPTFSRLYLIKSQYMKNDKGDWFNWKVEDAGWIPGGAGSPVYQGARDFYNIVNSPDFRMGKPADDTIGSAAPDDGDVPI